MNPASRPVEELSSIDMLCCAFEHATGWHLRYEAASAPALLPPGSRGAPRSPSASHRRPSGDPFAQVTRPGPSPCPNPPVLRAGWGRPLPA